MKKYENNDNIYSLALFIFKAIDFFLRRMSLDDWRVVPLHWQVLCVQEVLIRFIS